MGAAQPYSLSWPHGDSGAGVVFQHGSVSGQHSWAFISPLKTCWIWATPGLQLRGLLRGRRLLVTALPGGRGWGNKPFLAGDLHLYFPICVDKCKKLVCWGSPGPPPRLSYSQRGPIHKPQHIAVLMPRFITAKGHRAQATGGKTHEVWGRPAPASRSPLPVESHRMLKEV